MNDALPTETAPGDALGYFGPGSVSWLLYREPCFVLGGVRALLLQVAHPSVADGVARYSNFQADPFGRGYRTFLAMAMVYFGSRQQAEQTGQRLWRLHSGIRGEQPSPYTANDPHLLLWVLSTLTDTTLRVYEGADFLPLPADWRERFYEESKLAAQLLGIPQEAYPPDLTAFRAYFEQMLHSSLLGSTDTCQQVAQAIVQHPRAPKRLAHLMATGSLPASLCERLGMLATPAAPSDWARWQRRFFRFYRLLPAALRQCPAFHQAQYRVALAQGARPTWAGRFFHFLARWMDVPLGLQTQKAAH